MRPAQDTTRDAQAAQDAAYAGLSAEQRIRSVIQLSEMVFRLNEDGIRARHPDYTDDEVRLTGIRLRIGDDLFVAAFPDAAILQP